MGRICWMAGGRRRGENGVSAPWPPLNIRRLISAASFADRVVHHALCNIIGPVLEERFIGGSYANRIDKGTHRVVDRLQQLAKGYRYGLRLDIVKHFPSIDHEILLDILRGPVVDEE